MVKQGMNRREFLIVAGASALAVPLVAALGGCGGGGGGTPAVPATSAGDFTITSTVASSHTHNITIKAADLTAGVDKTYTSDSGTGAPHTHTVTITAAQFNDINTGKTDTISSSIVGGHSHDFPVKKPA